jgi:uncharacterized membrane protein
MDKTARRHGFERLLNFSDAVFAIAITLLVLEIRLPPGATRFDLAAVFPQILGFAISFFVIGRFWLAHHHLMESLHGYSGRLLRANLLFLAAVVFLPFPTTVVSELTWTPATVGFYGLSLAAIGVLLLWLIWTARRPDLLHHGETRGRTVYLLVNGAATTAIFLLTALLGQFWPSRAMLTLLLLIPVGAIANGIGGRLERRIDGSGHRGEPALQAGAGDERLAVQDQGAAPADPGQPAEDVGRIA